MFAPFNRISYSEKYGTRYRVQRVIAGPMAMRMPAIKYLFSFEWALNGLNWQSWLTLCLGKTQPYIHVLGSL